MRVNRRAIPKKLSLIETARIREMYEKGELSQQRLARKYGVSQARIWEIVHRCGLRKINNWKENL